MASAKALLGKVLGPLVFRAATVTRVRALAPRFLSVRIEGDALRGASFEPGDKVQVFIPEIGMRTYSPIDWDTMKGAFELIVFAREASTPSVTWARSLAEGTVVNLFGPRRSLRVPAAAPVVLVGDETSVGVARALRASSPGALRVVLEADDAAEVTVVARDAGLRAEVVERTPGGAHFPALAAAIVREAQASPGAGVYLTGSAITIQAVQRTLRARQIRPAATRPYWSPGKIGLD
jgi:NADPH-dependent ferric siderophore reductase